MQAFDAIVLAGGHGRRLGGVDKAALEIGPASLLDRALAAVAAAARTVVVGPERPLPAGVVGVCEDPPGGGPVAAVAAAVAHVEQTHVVVLACDMPFVSPATVERLVTGRDLAPDGALLVDGDGRRQPLCAVYRADALRSALTAVGSPGGAAMRTLVGHLRVTEMVAHPGETVDCDTWDDVDRSRQLMEDS